MQKYKIEISPSVMCMDFRHLEEDFRILEEAGADRFHFDIMDGHFVPNITLGQDIIRSLRSVTDLPFEAHLMIENPENFLERFIDADIIIFHLESTKAPIRLARTIRDLKKRVSVAINPITPPELLLALLCEIDEVLVMTVEPGFAGQRFIPKSVEKVKKLKELIDRENPTVRIEVDGAISIETGRLLKTMGAEIFVGGTSSLFTPDRNLKDNLKDFKRALSTYI